MNLNNTSHTLESTAHQEQYSITPKILSYPYYHSTSAFQAFSSWTSDDEYIQKTIFGFRNVLKIRATNIVAIIQQVSHTDADISQ